MAAEDVYRVTLNWIINDQNVSNVIHVKQLDADAGEDPEQKIADGIGQIVDANWKASMANTSQLSEIIVKCIYPTPRQARVFNANIVGTSGDDPLPSASHVVFSLYTDEHSKKGRGRIRLAGLTDTMVTNANVTDTAKTTIQTFLQALLQTWTATGSAIHFAGHIWSTVDTLARDIVRGILRPNVRAMRQRRKS